MFRSLATRLTATYVFAAVVLVVIVVCAFTALALSMFGLSAREETDDVARQAPEVVRLAVVRTGSLEAAAVSVVKELSRPGLHVAVFAERGRHRRFLAASAATDAGGRPIIVEGPRFPDRPFEMPMVSTPPRSGGPGDAGFGEGPLPSNDGFTRSFMDPENHFGPRPGTGGHIALVLSRGEIAPDDFGGSDSPLDRMRPYPLGLNSILHIEPKNIAIPGGHIGIMPDPAPLARSIDMFWLAMLPTGIFAVLAAWFLGRFITLQALRPLVETTESLDRFGAGDFTPRSITTAERNEIGSLVTAYNSAAAQVARALEERKAAEEQMRQFIADAGHELRTPLTVIMGFIDILRRRALSDPGAPSTKIFDTMLDESRRMKALIDKLILLARLENLPQRELQTVDLVELTRSIVDSLRTLRGGTPIAFACDSTALVRGDESELHDAVSNIIENAVKYSPGVQVDVRVRGEGDDVVVDVIDTGPGIPLDEQSQVFDRFYRGRDRSEGDGFGLGLAIAKRAVERAGGAIVLHSSPGEGSRFSIRIPQARVRIGRSGTTLETVS